MSSGVLLFSCSRSRFIEQICIMQNICCKSICILMVAGLKSDLETVQCSGLAAALQTFSCKQGMRGQNCSSTYSSGGIQKWFTDPSLVDCKRVSTMKCSTFILYCTEAQIWLEQRVFARSRGETLEGLVTSQQSLQLVPQHGRTQVSH